MDQRIRAMTEDSSTGTATCTEWQNLRFQEAVGQLHRDFPHPADPQGHRPHPHDSHRARDDERAFASSAAQQ